MIIHARAVAVAAAVAADPKTTSALFPDQVHHHADAEQEPKEK